jgi:hypothetical protein
MQFIRSWIAAPPPSESRSVALWKQLGVVLCDQDLCDLSAAELRVRGRSQSRAILSRKIDLSFVGSLLWNSLIIARLLGILTIYCGPFGLQN